VLSTLPLSLQEMMMESNMKSAKDIQREEELTRLINPKPRAAYTINMFLRRVRTGVEEMFKDIGGVDFCPDYQRGHVWTESQQILFIESLIQGYLPSSLLTLQFNCPHWENFHYQSPDLPREAQCLDGLQRYTAMVAFVEGRIKAFGLTVDEFSGTRYSVNDYTFTVTIQDFKTKKEVLGYYLRLNAGGTQHTADEIKRVEAMRDSCV
jgi:hypothetical protein